jgi:hypothetical protein
MENELKLANFIFLLSKSAPQNEKDLRFSLNKFIENEEYEKCVLLNELLNSKKFKINGSHYQFYQFIQKAKNKVNSSLDGLMSLRNDSKDRDLNDSIKKGEKLLGILEDDEREFFRIIERMEKEIKNLENLTGKELIKVKKKVKKKYGKKPKTNFNK